MKMHFMLVAALWLLLSTFATAQEHAATPATAVTMPSTKALVVFGRVSHDARTLLSDLDSEWIVSNSESLKGHEGRLVKVKCFVDTERNKLSVLSVRDEESGARYATAYGDSAFRR